MASLEEAVRRIRLSDCETRIFECMRECVRTNAALLGVELRIAGGWVRDKLLGEECHDCDVAINTLTGEAFAAHFRAYLVARGVATGSLGVIQANPARSKHLATATLSVLGYSLDFVNLRRNEAYAEDSRIPASPEFGTPADDALRRDITVNALFYNLRTEDARPVAQAATLEDWSGAGLADLGAGVIRTPLAPRETLLDDPLRALRVVRFAARLGFAVEPSLFEALGARCVASAFRRKISRERVGTELGRMLERRERAADALRMLVDAGLYALVFDPCAIGGLPSACDYNASVASVSQASASSVSLRDAPAWAFSDGDEDAGADVLRALDAIRGPLRGLVDGLTDEQHRMLMLCTAMLPLAAGVVVRPSRANKPNAPTKEEPLVVSVVREAIKLTGADAAEAGRLLDPRLLATYAALFDRRTNRRLDEADAIFVSPSTAASPLFPRVVALRSRAGDIAWAVRAAGPNWPVAVVLAALSAPGPAAEVCAKAAAFAAGVRASPSACGAHAARPILGGEDILRILGERLPPGTRPDARLVGPLTDAVLTFQFSHAPAIAGTPGPSRADAEDIVRSLLS